MVTWPSYRPFINFRANTCILSPWDSLGPEYFSGRLITPSAVWISSELISVWKVVMKRSITLASGFTSSRSRQNRAYSSFLIPQITIIQSIISLIIKQSHFSALANDDWVLGSKFAAYFQTSYVFDDFQCVLINCFTKYSAFAI